MNREDFPMLNDSIIYFDNGATTLKPKQVIDAVNKYYLDHTSNIHRGDYLLIVKQDNYNVGDVVTFQINGNFITHRIIKKEGKRIVTKGDANNTEDDEINESQIIGKLMYKSKLFNFIIDFKFLIISLFIAGYLVTCYFDDKEKEPSDEEVKE